jgi:ribosome-binding protein aMBF1 (putative translation factor)
MKMDTLNELIEYLDRKWRAGEPPSVVIALEKAKTLRTELEESCSEAKDFPTWTMVTPGETVVEFANRVREKIGLPSLQTKTCVDYDEEVKNSKSYEYLMHTRRYLGLTYRDIADRMDRDLSWVSAVEHGTTKLSDSEERGYLRMLREEVSREYFRRTLLEAAELQTLLESTELQCKDIACCPLVQSLEGPLQLLCTNCKKEFEDRRAKQERKSNDESKSNS